MNNITVLVIFALLFSSNAYSADSDFDGIDDSIDNCPMDSNPSQSDADLDAVGNICDNCVSIANGPAEDSQKDTDGDTMGDACDPDDDNDGVNDFLADGITPLDNCRLVANASQTNTDQALFSAGNTAVIADGLGDACDDDDDGDGVLDVDEAANDTDPLNPDSDTDGGALLVDPSLNDSNDNCPTVSNPFQVDTNSDGEGDACDADMDGDNLLNAADACPLRPSLTPGVGNGYDANCDHICWRPHAGLPGSPVPPTIDGVVDGPTTVTHNGNTSTHQTDIGWRGAHRVVYHNGTTVPHMAFQALKDNSEEYVYLSFEVKNDSLSANDRVVVTFRPDINVAGATFAPGNQDGDIRIIVTPQSNTILVSTYLSGAWNDISKPANLIFMTAADGTDAWDLEMKVPSSSATSGSAWANFGSHFNFYFNVLRNNGSVAEFGWPDNQHLVNGNILDYPYVASEWGIGTTDAAACSGVYLTATDIRTNNTPDNSINLLSANTFFADVNNDSAATANNINVTFRIADWGITDGVSNNADWREIPSSDPACPNAGADNNPTCSKNVPVTGETFSLNWSVDPAERDMYDPTATPPGYKHQCIMAELDSTSDANITVSSVYRNMNFDETASVFQRKARISANGLGTPPSGKAEHQFILQESRMEMKPIRIKEYMAQAKKQRATGITTHLPDYDDRDEDAFLSRTQWLVHGYRETGNYVEIDDVQYPIIDPVSSFGYVISHTGEAVSEWDYGIEGAERDGDGMYTLSVPENGSREILTRVESIEGGGSLLELLKDKPWLLAFIILIVIYLLWLVLRKNGSS